MALSHLAKPTIQITSNCCIYRVCDFSCHKSLAKIKVVSYTYHLEPFFFFFLYPMRCRVSCLCPRPSFLSTTNNFRHKHSSMPRRQVIPHCLSLFSPAFLPLKPFQLVRHILISYHVERMWIVFSKPGLNFYLDRLPSGTVMSTCSISDYLD